MLRMTILLNVALLFVSFIQGNEVSWDSLIASKKYTIDVKAYEVIVRQYEAFAADQAPKVVDPCIKSIPIIESHELAIDINSMQNKRISMMPQPHTVFASPDCNSGLPTASKIRKTVFENLENMLKELDRLAPLFGYEPEQITIKVFEGLRDIATQEMLFNNKAQEIRTANPHMSDDEIFSETCKWVSPVINNVPVHSTGAAIDIRLWNNKTQEFLDLGKFGVIWGKNSHAPTFSSELSLEQKNNRLFMIFAATQAGLVNYCYEFWHYSTGDRYASFWKESDVSKREAIYSSIKQKTCFV